MSARMTPFHCPYCGEENLWPHEADAAASGDQPVGGHGAWECRSCMRAFKVSFLGILRPTASSGDRSPDPTPEREDGS